MGFEKKRDAVLSLKPDILVLQECSARDIANTDAPFKYWVGSNKHKGMAIIGFANYAYAIDSSYTQEWPWFLPICVEDVPFHLLGLWACVKDQYLRYVRVTHQAIEHYARFLSMPHVIAIGDFNSNTLWDRHYREYSHSNLVKKLESLELVSVYHTLRGEIQGQEATPTQFMYRNLAKSYHLDYAFVSQAMSRSCELLVGEPGEWLRMSDHMPLLLTVSI
jgi:endonuclease/exonuclease/phosphatase family metal-dependent hydrolase